ncbi:aminotransferase class I/II-fold pyridoxal phosphate-dependent enzyme [bacterium]|nr:aminotransferase class I/II-fold pyridoxal phosphate-dependent enzyme [bacterium]
MKEHAQMTDCVHSGTIFDPATRGAVSPIYPASSNGYLDAEENIYPRYFNLPNQRVLEKKMSALEKGEAAVIFSSGMAAISTTLFSVLNKGDHAVFQIGLYGGTTNFVTTTFEKFGIEYTFTEGTDIGDFEAAIQPNTKLIYVESPSNPLLGIVDIARVAKLAKSKKILSIIDNTFASPINQRPLDLGIDVVLHSATKYLGGHSDMCAGALVARKKFVSKVRLMARNLGGSLNANMCAVLERSLRTLAVRVEQQNRNAKKIAEFLQGHSLIENVYFPGLASHPGHEIASRQMRGFGGMVSFELAAGLDPCGFQKRLKLIAPSLSLGGVETVVSSPFLTSHVEISAEQRAEAGIKDSLLRLSVGIEEPDDLIADLEQALTKSEAFRNGPVKPALVAVHF